MSTIPDKTDDDDTDAWAELAQYRETLEMIIDEDLPFAPYAENLLEELDKRGYY
jgi:hypothetical protein